MAGWALCMTLVLVALAGSVSCQTYRDFQRKHWDYPRTPVQPVQRYCDIMIQRRQVMARGDPCRTRHTFVHAPAQDLVDACSQMPDAVGRYTTPRALSLTACRLLTGRTWPRCTYRPRQVLHFVLVNCRNGLPVHLNSTHP